MPRSWIDKEPGAVAIARQIVELYARAARRPLLTLAIALAVALLVVGAAVLKKRTFAPQVVLRVIEADHQAGVAPRPKRRLRDYVQQAVFSNHRLTEIIRERGLYPSLARKNPQAALMSFKEDIEVSVYRNYFVEERTKDDPPRSARIAIRYHSPDRRLALDVGRQLANLVAEHELKTRADQLALAARDAGAELARARAALLEHRRAIAQKTLEAQQYGDTQITVELSNLQRSMGGLERQVAEVETRKAALDFNASLEKGQLGLRFEIVDKGAIPESAGLHAENLLLLGAFTFFFGLPLVGLAVGAFDTRIRDVEDLTRLGVRPLGQLRISKGRAEGYA
jgi:hypothetical protein